MFSPKSEFVFLLEQYRFVQILRYVSVILRH